MVLEEVLKYKKEGHGPSVKTDLWKTSQYHQYVWTHVKEDDSVEYFIPTTNVLFDEKEKEFSIKGKKIKKVDGLLYRSESSLISNEIFEFPIIIDKENLFGCNMFLTNIDGAIMEHLTDKMYRELLAYKKAVKKAKKAAKRAKEEKKAAKEAEKKAKEEAEGKEAKPESKPKAAENKTANAETKPVDKPKEKKEEKEKKTSATAKKSTKKSTSKSTEKSA